MGMLTVIGIKLKTHPNPPHTTTHIVRPFSLILAHTHCHPHRPDAVEEEKWTQKCNYCMFWSVGTSASAHTTPVTTHSGYTHSSLLVIFIASRPSIMKNQLICMPARRSARHTNTNGRLRIQFKWKQCDETDTRWMQWHILVTNRVRVTLNQHWEN